jgi:hypothetical protein
MMVGATQPMRGSDFRTMCASLVLLALLLGLQIGRAHV